MSILAILIPVALAMGALGLVAFGWSLRNGQFEDLSGDAERIFFDEHDAPLPDRHKIHTETTPKETKK
ncbi:cbb3-type cytochrome oxidase assembly protein CcoS [Sulfitobacter aestuarii]|uniref:Cbb3-type cytochrome oxidase assembly protein CcoS n=1 Tax=Sulfitobacter aestuarii TaxID=2161676 RepID=A0ABW5U2H7_9RHOB